MGWSEWHSAEEWEKIGLPKCAGIYQVRAVVSRNNPISLSLATLHANDETTFRHRYNDLAGVVYIGLASCLHCRFGQLVSTWNLKGKRKTNPHNSYTTWKDKHLEAMYPKENMEFRYYQATTITWRSHQPNDKVREIKDTLWPEQAKVILHQTADTAASYESQEFNKYKKFTGLIPPLNKDDESHKGDEHFRELAKLYSSQDEDNVANKQDEPEAGEWQADNPDLAIEALNRLRNGVPVYDAS